SVAILAATKFIAGTGISTSTLGAGMIVSVRITGSAIVYGLLWTALTPWLRSMGWLGENDPFRKCAFTFALGTIMGAAAVDIALILRQAVQKLRDAAPVEAPNEAEAWKKTD